MRVDLLKALVTHRLIQKRQFLLTLCALPWGAHGAPSKRGESRFFTTSDGQKLHYIEAGSGPVTLIFVPGWLMPAQIFEMQIHDLSRDHRVIVLDPRGQGRSMVAPNHLDAVARARDIQDLLDHLEVSQHVMVGWSLGVMEVLDHLTRHGRLGLRGLVLIDNSIGMASPPAPRSTPHKRPVKPDEFRTYIRRFAQNMFKSKPPEGWMELIERSATQLPPQAAWALLDKPYQRDYYKQAVLNTDVPIWYAITEPFKAQAAELVRTHPRASAYLFEGSGHALFVDAAALFNEQLRFFLKQLS
jgi:microsomal epoxide hydrolase